jgi:mono/diheme cytochrome c family protein
MKLHTATFIFGTFTYLLLAGCKATPPGKLEGSVVGWVKHNVTVKGKHDPNPIRDTPANVESGKHTFGFYCVVCHGRDGQNTGVPFAKGISPPIPSLASTDVQRYTDGQLHWIIDNGIAPSGMPASHNTLSDDDIWTIVVFLRHLPPAGSLGEPRAYSGDEYSEPPADSDAKP